LTGPIYTVYKALSAAALAQRLEKLLDRPVVPVFWTAGDDHDFAESNHCFVPATSNEVTRLTLRERRADGALTPMYREIVGKEIEPVLEQLELITPETEFRSEVLRWLRSHYEPTRDLADAFAGAMAELLGHFGIVAFSPTHIDAKRAMSSWILRALENSSDLDRSLGERAEELRERGEAAPISVGDGATTVMMESILGRDRLLIDGDSFCTRRAKERWTADALAEIAQDKPECLSPNVLLRPVIEAAILPTLAYVAGPGELGYLPQTLPVYDMLGVEPQAVVRRWGGWVIENRTAKTLSKFDIGVADLNLPEGQLEARLLLGKMPSEATEAIGRLHECVEREYAILADSIATTDSTLTKPILAARSGALSDLKGVEKRIARALKQQNETTLRQLANARSSLFPLGKPQERIVNITHFLIRYGTEFLDAVFDECRRWADTLETVSNGT
jgi:bacillithiol biosynthesis cysteine-adding enzyme BshC